MAKLTRLERMAFSRDSYTSLGLVDIESYYVDTGIDETQWESQHQGMVSVEADKYVWVLPKLEWLYFGQLPIRHGERRGGRERKMVV